MNLDEVYYCYYYLGCDGAFFGFDELWKIMGFKKDEFGTPTCSNEYVRRILLEQYLVQLAKDGGIDNADIRDFARELRKNTSIHFGIPKKLKSDKENHIYCEADFSAKNDNAASYFKSSGSVKYDIRLASREKIKSLPKRELIRGWGLENASYEEMPLGMLLSV